MSSQMPATPVPPPPGGATPMDRRGRPLPRWSTIDTWPVFILVALALLTLITTTTDADGDGSAAEAVTIGGGALFTAILIQQVIQFGWPWLVSKWKGLGLRSDWRFEFDWKRDPGIGLLLAVAAVVLSAITTAIVTAIVGLSDTEDPSNTSIISDNEGSPWLIGVILLVVIGAPLSEELLFRGLTLRALEKDLGIYVGVIGSTLLFTLPHIQANATSGETAVLLSGLFVVGLVWGVATAKLGRLGPAIISHVIFNAFGTLMTLN